MHRGVHLLLYGNLGLYTMLDRLRIFCVVVPRSNQMELHYVSVVILDLCHLPLFHRNSTSPEIPTSPMTVLGEKRIIRAE